MKDEEKLTKKSAKQREGSRESLDSIEGMPGGKRSEGWEVGGGRGWGEAGERVMGPIIVAFFRVLVQPR